jgi:hypothetical protein
MALGAEVVVVSLDSVVSVAPVVPVGIARRRPILDFTT